MVLVFAETQNGKFKKVSTQRIGEDREWRVDFEGTTYLNMYEGETYEYYTSKETGEDRYDHNSDLLYNKDTKEVTKLKCKKDY